MRGALEGGFELSSGHCRGKPPVPHKHTRALRRGPLGAFASWLPWARQPMPSSQGSRRHVSKFSQKYRRVGGQGTGHTTPGRVYDASSPKCGLVQNGPELCATKGLL